MKNKFIRNLGMLGIIGLVIKLIGALYRVPLAIFMTEEAISYYSLAYPWYNMLIIVTSGAIPAVTAKLTAEAIAENDTAGKLNTFYVTRRLMTGLGLITALLMFLFAGIVSSALGYPESTYSFFVLGIAAYFVAMNASFRGFFQGEQKLQFYAISQLIEQIGRVTLGIGVVALFAGLAFNDSLLAAAGTSGTAFGGLLSWGYLSYKFKKQYPEKPPKHLPMKAIGAKIAKLVVPLALGASIMPLLAMIDGTLVVWRLQNVGFVDTAAILFSYVSFYSAPIINISQVVFSALQVILLPMITTSFTQKSDKLKRQIELGILLSIVLGLPIGIGIAGFSKEILLFFYPSKESVATDAASVLTILGGSIVFLSLYLATTSILQGMNAYNKPVQNLFVGAVVKVVTAYVLIGIPAVNIDGAAYSTLLAYGVAALLNTAYVFKLSKPGKLFYQKVGLTLFANSIMMIFAKLLFSRLTLFLPMRLNLLISVGLAALVYFVAIVGFKIVRKVDFDAIEKA
ncbi:putative polysaccharide biosynthesis protein [Fusibacter tunisiensis]|uniref:Stage V sporulation protein B n=1 Tax=Fusibacter tunisiensis TaxID=1008308 RepID=A0ABS2MRH3_9FIRM|nr:polysaccharide biosynthesis protein [Fusibacter tunisiensis]MBM7562018.1 stage V sporulation protein B [Fusibacter tunisiensis]